MRINKQISKYKKMNTVRIKQKQMRDKKIKEKME